jgi:uncharacterized membrane protein
MKLARLASALIAIAGFAACPDAHAWVKIKNTTAHGIGVAHAYDTINTWLCGEFDGCDSGGTMDYRIEGWWTVNSGSTVTVSGYDYSHMFYYLYAYDQYGHWWGGSRDFNVANDAFSICGGGYQNLRSFWAVKTSRCCGLTCGQPANMTIIF